MEEKSNLFILISLLMKKHCIWTRLTTSSLSKIKAYLKRNRNSKLFASKLETLTSKWLMALILISQSWCRLVSRSQNLKPKSCRRSKKKWKMQNSLRNKFSCISRKRRKGSWKESNANIFKRISDIVRITLYLLTCSTNKDLNKTHFQK